jgi:hypothetical protein
MSIETPTAAQLTTYFATLRTELTNVPELEIGLTYTEKDPEFAADTYLGYVALVSHVAELSEGGRRAIRSAQAWMKKHAGNFGTASEVSADDLVAELGGHATVLRELSVSSANPASPYFKPAMAELARRMEGGHRLKEGGGNPGDDDPESKKVIWGHTMMPHFNPQALTHFMIAHYTERYVAAGLTNQGSKLAAQKDFLLNALIDVLILDHLAAHRFAGIYEVWRRSKDGGGLGWITDDRLASYEIQEET